MKGGYLIRQLPSDMSLNLKTQSANPLPVPGAGTTLNG